MTVPQQRPSPVQRASSGTLAEVVELILDKGLVIDAFVRVSLVGIELLTVDARVVVASVDTYLRFAEATNRLDLYGKGGATLPDLVEGISEGGARGVAKGKTRGMLDAAKETFDEVLGGRDSGERAEGEPRDRSREGRRERPPRREREP